MDMDRASDPYCGEDADCCLENRMSLKGSPREGVTVGDCQRGSLLFSRLFWCAVSPI